MGADTSAYCKERTWIQGRVENQGDFCNQSMHYITITKKICILLMSLPSLVGLPTSFFKSRRTHIHSKYWYMHSCKLCQEPNSWTHFILLFLCKLNQYYWPLNPHSIPPQYSPPLSILLLTVGDDEVKIIKFYCPIYLSAI